MLKLTFPFIMKIATKIPVINPYNTKILIWDFSNLFFLSISVFFIPMKICFEIILTSNNNFFFFYFLELIPNYFFILDMILKCDTAYFYKGALVENKYEILKNYIKNSFLLDFITLAPFFIFTHINYFHFIFLLRLIKMKHLVKKITENIFLPEESLPLLELLSLLFKVIYLAHLCGCAWHFIAIQEIKMGYSITWIHKNDLLNEGSLVRYINALYYSVLTMITVGHVSTDSHTEKAASIFLVLILSGIFAYSLSSISNLVQEISKNNQELK